MKNKESVLQVIKETVRKHGVLSAGLFAAVCGAVIFALLPPLILAQLIDRLTKNHTLWTGGILLYFGLLALTGFLESARESLLTVFGQRITHALRSSLMEKFGRLSANELNRQEPGALVSRFVGDVDTVENLFTSGIISMFADACKVISIFAILFIKNKGLALVLLLLTPLIFLFTRMVQKRMLAAQIDNRIAVEKATNHVPETIKSIRTIHSLRKEKYMCEVYDKHIQDSYNAVEKTNFYDAVYSPIILIINAFVVAVVMLLSATGVPGIQSFFGMSVGTAVAVINYISSIFGPLESIGMEIQTIQSAVAGVHRIDEFLSLDERFETDENIDLNMLMESNRACVELQNVTFGYEPNSTILNNLSLTINTGEQITLSGRTGAGKSTIFKLLLGQYKADSGNVFIYGQDASKLPDNIKRKFFGYVEQHFRMIPGTVLEQITLFDESINREMAEKAAITVGLHSTICKLEKGYNTPCTSSLFSQGQWQLLSIARAIASEPKLLLLDEITANLDADTEQSVLKVLKRASENRTVISISHRLYQQTGGRQIAIK